MRALLKLISCIGLLFISTTLFAHALRSQSVSGYWKTFDGKTHQPSSIIHVYPSQAVYFGKVIKGFSQPGKQQSAFCVTCQGKEKNKPIIGMVIIRNMTCQNGKCHGGTILDPRSGNIYHATMRLIRNGRWMKVRGYVGMPMFGKTVIWKRVQ